MLRIGRLNYGKGQKVPNYPGFTNVIVMMKSNSKWHKLSPYFLRNNKGQILENIWQFSKLYETVPKSTQRYSRFDNTIIWQHPAETHLREGKITQEYVRWREKGMNNRYPVRYPVGRNHRDKCLCAFKDLVRNPPSMSPRGHEEALLPFNQDSKPLNYIQARKEIYLPFYVSMVEKEPQFYELKQRLKAGENLMIIEVDGPHQESLDYYKQTYGVNDEFIQQETMLATPENLNIMLNDKKHPFGHGYALAWALLEITLPIKYLRTSTGLVLKINSGKHQY